MSQGQGFMAVTNWKRGALAALAPFFGRQTLVWLVDAGGLGIVIAYAMVAVSFLILRSREPELERPYKV